jgi:hypothetical protein
VSSLSPNSVTRYIAFRVISKIVLSVVKDEALRLSIIYELIKDAPFPQMRAAAIGLLKNSVLAALGSSTVHQSNEEGKGSQKLLASKVMLETVSTELFRLHNNLAAESASDSSGQQRFSEKPELELKSFTDGPEATRVTEVLNFYYALLVADKLNAVSLTPSALIG